GCSRPRPVVPRSHDDTERRQPDRTGDQLHPEALAGPLQHRSPRSPVAGPAGRARRDRRTGPRRRPRPPTRCRGRPGGRGPVACVVGNEDGAHAITAAAFQGLNDIGFTIPAQGVTYWNGEAMQTVDYLDLDETPEKTAGTTATVAANAAHLARLLKAQAYPE